MKLSLGIANGRALVRIHISAICVVVSELHFLDGNRITMLVLELRDLACKSVSHGASSHASCVLEQSLSFIIGYDVQVTDNTSTSREILKNGVIDGHKASFFWILDKWVHFVEEVSELGML